MQTLLFVLGVLSFSLPLSARIGDTREKCTWRYGEPTPVDAGDDSLSWANGSYIIIARFFEGACDRISFKRLDKKPITTEETVRLLRDCGGERKWEPLPNTGDGIAAFITSDFALIAAYEDAEQALSIKTEGAIKRLKAGSESEPLTGAQVQKNFDQYSQKDIKALRFGGYDLFQSAAKTALESSSVSAGRYAKKTLYEMFGEDVLASFKEAFDASGPEWLVGSLLIHAANINGIKVAPSVVAEYEKQSMRLSANPSLPADGAKQVAIFYAGLTDRNNEAASTKAATPPSSESAPEKSQAAVGEASPNRLSEEEYIKINQEVIADFKKDPRQTGEKAKQLLIRMLELENHPSDQKAFDVGAIYTINSMLLALANSSMIKRDDGFIKTYQEQAESAAQNAPDSRTGQFIRFISDVMIRVNAKIPAK